MSKHFRNIGVRCIRKVAKTLKYFQCYHVEVCRWQCACVCHGPGQTSFNIITFDHYGRSGSQRTRKMALPPLAFHNFAQLIDIDVLNESAACDAENVSCSKSHNAAAMTTSRAIAQACAVIRIE